MDNFAITQVLRLVRKHAQPRNGKKMVFWHHAGLYSVLGLDTLIALTMELRGYDVHFIVCDGIAPACFGRVDYPGQYDQWAHKCTRCIQTSIQQLETFGFSYSTLSQHLKHVDLAELRKYTQLGSLPSYGDGIDLNIAHLDGVIRHHLGGDPASFSPDMIEQLAFTTLCNYHAAKEVLATMKPDRTCILHCAYSDHLPPFKVFTSNGVSVTSYSVLYFPDQMMFNTVSDPSQDIIRKISDEQWKKLVQDPWTDIEEKLFVDFFKARYEKLECWDTCLHAQMDFIKKEELRQVLGLDAQRPVFLLPLNLTFDVSLQFAYGFFTTYDEQVVSIIKEIIKNDRVQWLLKIHPSEAQYNATTGAHALIKKTFPELPEHVKIVPDSTPYSSLAFYHLANGILGGAGTAVSEMAALGKTALMTSKTLYYGKGFTVDPVDRNDLYQYIQNAHKLPKPTSEQTLLARKFLIAYFYKMGIELPHFDVAQWTLTKAEGLVEYLPGRNKHVELLADSIEKGIIPMIPAKWLEQS